MQAIFRFFFVYLTSRASDTLKVQTDYLTFGNLITTSDTPKVQSSEAIALNQMKLISDEQTLHVGSKFKDRNPFGVRSTGSYLVLLLLFYNSF